MDGSIVSSSALRLHLLEYEDAIEAAHRAKNANSASDRIIKTKIIQRMTDWNGIPLGAECGWRPSGAVDKKNLHILATNHRRDLFEKFA